jgi:type II secretory pathway pseudopilin PulG
MKSGQKGFTVVETLLVLILVSIIGFTGYYVYHSRNNANVNYNNSANSSNVSTSSSSNSSKFVFKEIGVQVQLPSSLKDLSYTVFQSDNGNPNLALSTPEFVGALNKCDPTTVGTKNPAFAVITKQTGQFNQDENPGVGKLKQFKDFWISTASPNGIICADTATQQEKDNFFTIFHDSSSVLRQAFQSATLTQ